MPEVEVGVGVCACPDRSWAFPAAASVLADVGHEQFVLCHWANGVGWTPCVVRQEEYENLYVLVFDGQPRVPTFAEWKAGAQHAVDRANMRPLEHWRRLFLRAVERELAAAEHGVEGAEQRLARERHQALLAECRAVAARIADPVLAATAHRLLWHDWTGTPAELLATAEAVSNE